MAGEDDTMKDLFGSASESEEDALGHSAAQVDSHKPGAGGPGQHADTAGPSQQDQMRDLFGSDEESDDGYRVAGASDADDAGEEPASRGPPMVVETALVPPPDPSTLRLVRLSNVLGLEPAPFDPESFVGGDGAAARDAATIRWRWAPTGDGGMRRQSNARLVRWSDGSVQLLVGDEALDAAALDVSGDQVYLFARHGQIIQGQGQIAERLAFQPTGLTSALHRRLAGRVEGTGMRVARVRATTTLADPARLKRERETAEEQRIRERERLAQRVQRGVPRRAGPAAIPARAPRLSAAFLEEEEPDIDADWDARRGAAFDEDAEARAAARIAAAKREPPPGVKRGRTIGSDDEGLSDEPAQQGSPGASEEEARQRKDPGRRLSGGKRTVLLDSDDDD